MAAPSVHLQSWLHLPKLTMLNIDDIKKLIQDGNHAEAVRECDIIIAKYPTSGPLLLQRSIAHLRAGNPELALPDAESAVRHLQGEKRADAQLRRAISLFKVGKPGEAKCVVAYAAGKSTETSQVKFWTSKLKNEEAVEVPEIPKGPKLPFASSPSGGGAPEVRKNWYQSSTAVTVDVYLKGAPKDAAIKIESQRVFIKYGEIDFSLKLFAEVVPELSKYTIGGPKIELVLDKKEQVQWPKLEFDPSVKVEKVPQVSPIAKEARAPGRLVPFFERNWDLSDEEDEPESQDPNAFFESIYKNADPDTRRAMMKSFTESKGTSLSTNWDEVSKGEVKPLPPKDMNLE